MHGDYRESKYSIMVWMQQSIIYTIGTDLRTGEDFIEILLACEIRAFIDVRSFPKSRLPHFNKDALQEFLESNGIRYHFLGKELGGLRKGGYVSYSMTEEFLAGIEMLEGIARGTTAVLACAERFPWKCHRRWIAKELRERGWSVHHIIDKGNIWIPQ